MTTEASNLGTVDAVRGSVVDVYFPEKVPPLYHILKTGEQGEVVIEVVSHLDARTVRGITLTPTRGLARGSEVFDTGETLKVPVGERVLGRMFDVFGDTIDRKGV